MAYTLCHDILIGDYKLSAVESVTIETSVEQIADFCRISLPTKQHNKAFAIEDKIKRGDRVTVALGYDGYPVTEFIGYVTALKPNAPFVIECEDGAYGLRKPIADKQFKKVSLVTILMYIVSQVKKTGSKLELVCDTKGVRYESFTIVNATALQALSSLKESSGLAIYVRGDKLHCHLRYTEKLGEAHYDFSRNVEESDDLEFVRAEDVKVKIQIIGGGKKSKAKGEAGVDGGEKITLKRPNIESQKALNRIAAEELKKHSFDGYRGSLKTWLIPFVGIGYTAHLVDPDYPNRSGRFYVSSVKTEFSAQTGGRRTVGLGLRLSLSSPRKGADPNDEAAYDNDRTELQQLL
ncbi:hypothetical protein ACAW74_25890 [Fibrella sp. WM1]|uniref:hypothetical protein n=1 Tax=Fibrella musci TaxID=3242485 RepID=UPI0035205185